MKQLPSVRITSRGRVTLLTEVRGASQLRAGDHLLLRLTGKSSAAVIRRTRAPQVEDAYGIFRGVARPGITREEERAAYHEALARKYVPWT